MFLTQTVQFSTERFRLNGRSILHTHFGNVQLEYKFSQRPEHRFLENQIQQIVNASNNLVVLNKAGGAYLSGLPAGTVSLYSLLPNKTIVISDTDERTCVINSGTSLTLRDLITDTIKDRLNTLQGGTPPASRSYDYHTDPRLEYGYAYDLRRNLGIFEVER